MNWSWKANEDDLCQGEYLTREEAESSADNWWIEEVFQDSLSDPEREVYLVRFEGEEPVETIKYMANGYTEPSMWDQHNIESKAILGLA